LADPFLLAHLVNPLFFDLGGRLAPISIRDQMIRARMAVDRSLEEGLIGFRRPLLVIGAGAAGATAAMRAAESSVLAWLIDAAPAPFLRQAGCRTRWIDPTQYDWPVEHWQVGRYPWQLPPMPLPWVKRHANLTALAWSVALKRARRRHGRHLRVLFHTFLARQLLIRGTNTLRVMLGRHGKLLAADVGMVLSCVGAGTEKSAHGSYTGFDFWSTDPFQHLGPDDKVLISGGGDGALQDYLRVVTRQSAAADIYSSLAIPPAMERSLQSAEDQATRLYTWGAGPRHDHEPLRVLHESHAKLVEKLLPGPGSYPPDADLLDALKKLTSRTPDTVTLMYPCNHFSRCYGLNRFLVLLLATYLSRYKGRATLLPERSLAQVAGVGHRCANSPVGCHGQGHTIIPELHSDCRTGKGPAVSPLPGDYTVVIVRHGINPPPPLVAGTRQIAQTRQILPYHVSP
jgi:hypothetical protein